MGQSCLQVGQRREVSRGLGETCGVDGMGEVRVVRSSPVRGMRGCSLSVTAELPRERERKRIPGGFQHSGLEQVGEHFSYLSCRMDLGRSECGEGVKG